MDSNPPAAVAGLPRQPAPPFPRAPPAAAPLPQHRDAAGRPPPNPRPRLPGQRPPPNQNAPPGRSGRPPPLAASSGARDPPNRTFRSPSTPVSPTNRNLQPRTSSRQPALHKSKSERRLNTRPLQGGPPSAPLSSSPRKDVRPGSAQSNTTFPPRTSSSSTSSRPPLDADASRPPLRPQRSATAQGSTSALPPRTASASGAPKTSSSIPDYAPPRLATRSATDPILPPPKSPAARSVGALPSPRFQPPFARDSSMTTASSVYDPTASPQHMSMKTDTSSISDAMPMGRSAVPSFPGLKQKGSMDEVSVEEYIHMYTDDFRNSSARNSRDTARLPATPTLAELVEEAAGLPLPKLPPLELLETPLKGAPNALKKDAARTSAEIMAGKYDSARASTPSQPSSTGNVPRDRYGFKKENQFVRVLQYDAWNSYYQKYLDRRRAKWDELMKQYNLPLENPTHFPPRSDKVKRFVRKGIPPEWRGAAWFYYAGGPKRMASAPGLFKTLAAKADAGELPDGDREHIERDLHRTFPDNVHFKPDPDGQQARDSKLYNSAQAQTSSDDREEVPMIKSLRRVLRAFALYYPKIGYCQSLNFLAGQALLFLNGDEEKAFWLLCILTQEHLPGTHGLALEGANVDIGVLMSSLRDALPIMWAKLDDRADNSAEVRKGDMRLASGLPTVSLATTAWFMSCFIGTLPVETACRVWDVLFYEGSKTLFRVALGIFKIGERDIMPLADPMEVFQVIQTLPRRLLDANALMEASFGRGLEGRGLLSQETVEKRRGERRLLYQSERERFHNGDGLTSGNTSGSEEKKLNRAKSTLQRFKSRKRGQT